MPEFSTLLFDELHQPHVHVRHLRPPTWPAIASVALLHADTEKMKASYGILRW